MRRIEKIELGLYEIARECRTINRVATNQEVLNAIHEAGGEKVDDVLKELPEQHDDFLKDVHGKVVELLEMVGEYMNARKLYQTEDLDDADFPRDPCS